MVTHGRQFCRRECGTHKACCRIRILPSILDKPSGLCYNQAMKLIAQAKLKTDPEQTSALRSTMEQANACCNWLSGQAWEHGIFSQFKLHKLAYHEARRLFPTLSSQVVVRCIARVADAYKLDRKTRREFKPLSAVSYDARILRWYVLRQEVSIWAIGGRLRLSYEVGERQRALLTTLQGEADLVFSDGVFYLSQVCNVEEPPITEPQGFLGVDLGIKNIATDSDGNQYAGGHLNGLRARHARLRAKLQHKSTKSAKRLLKKRSRKEHRLSHHVNHVISKRLVERAKDTTRGIALEDLKGIRERVSVRKAHRRQLNSWAFYDLRQKIEYKAKLAGVMVRLVDPRNTSRTCPVCGSIDKANRPDQATFRCQACGFSGHADIIAAGVIARRAAVDQPYVSA